MANPYNSPWNKPRYQFINDIILYSKWKAIRSHLTSNPNISEFRGVLDISFGNQTIYIAKNSQKMRLKSHLDWAYYTPSTLAQAIDNNSVESYYEIMLNDIRSDPNQWKDTDFEMELKSFYAARVKRASLI